MRPIYKTYAPVTASADGLAAEVTGATWTLDATSSGDGLAHKVSITQAGATNHSGKTATVVGTDLDGKALTEVIAALPNGAATVTTTKHFLTVESVTPSATIGADTMTIGWGAESLGQTIPVEWRSNAQAAMTVDITGTINFTVEETYTNIYDTDGIDASWASISALAAKTADTSGAATLGTNAVRFKTNTVTNGATVTWSISQPSGYAI